MTVILGLLFLDLFSSSPTLPVPPPSLPPVAAPPRVERNPKTEVAERSEVWGWRDGRAKRVEGRERLSDDSHPIQMVGSTTEAAKKIQNTKNKNEKIKNPKANSRVASSSQIQTMLHAVFMAHRAFTLQTRTLSGDERYIN